MEVEPAFRVASRTPLFQVVGRYRNAASERRYDVALDDQSFLMIQSAASGLAVQGDDEAPPYIILVDNWFQELEELLRR